MISNSFRIEELSELSILFPFSERMMSRTTFIDEKASRGGIHCYYQLPEDIPIAFNQIDQSKIPFKNQQPIRIETFYECTISIHIALWEFKKDPIYQILNEGKVQGVSYFPKREVTQFRYSFLLIPSSVSLLRLVLLFFSHSLSFSSDLSAVLCFCYFSFCLIYFEENLSSYLRMTFPNWTKSKQK